MSSYYAIYKSSVIGAPNFRVAKRQTWGGSKVAQLTHFLPDKNQWMLTRWAFKYVQSSIVELDASNALHRMAHYETDWESICALDTAIVLSDVGRNTELILRRFDLLALDVDEKLASSAMRQRKARALRALDSISMSPETQAVYLRDVKSSHLPSIDNFILEAVDPASDTQDTLGGEFGCLYYMA